MDDGDGFTYVARSPPLTEEFGQERPLRFAQLAERQLFFFEVRAGWRRAIKAGKRAIGRRQLLSPFHFSSFQSIHSHESIIIQSTSPAHSKSVRQVAREGAGAAQCTKEIRLPDSLGVRLHESSTALAASPDRSGQPAYKRLYLICALTVAGIRQSTWS